MAKEKVMYAVVETGGKQYKVSAGETIEVEKLPFEVGEKVELDQVLLVSAEDEVQVGNPTVEGAKVMATVAGQGKGRKVIVFKYKPRNRYRRKAGHRQAYTRLQIDKIIV
jgi:large subunit ribosomal protein L21